MKKRAVIDSGPLIALFDRDDAHHRRVCDFLKEYRGSLHTSLAVVTEVAHLLDFSVRAQLDFLGWIRDGGLTLHPIDVPDLERICEMTEKYSDLPMDFADATLVRIAERDGFNEVVSIDRDFYVYRKSNRKALKNLLAHG